MTWVLAIVAVIIIKDFVIVALLRDLITLYDLAGEANHPDDGEVD